MKFKASMLAAVLALSAAGGAQAAAYVGTWDPAFGGNFTNLDWSGTVVVDIPDACLALGSASFANLECQASQVLSASVTLSNHLQPANVDVLNFFQPALKMGLYDITVAGGELTGLFTNLLKPVAPFITNPSNWLAPAGTLMSPDVPSWYADYLYGVFINGDKASLQASSTSIDFSLVGSGGDPVDALPGDCGWNGDYAICYSETEPTVTFTRLPVPEPGSLALTALAVAAAGAVRQRRRRAA